MQGARDGPRMNPVGPRHRVAGGLVAYKHWMRDRMRCWGQRRVVARAAQVPRGIKKPRKAGTGSVTGCGKGEQGIVEL